MNRAAIFIAILLFTSQAAPACKVRPLSVEGRANESSAIYIGWVSGVHIPTLETEQGNLYGLGRLNRKVRVFVSRTLKGKEATLLEFEARWCGGGAWEAEPGKNVVVYLGVNNHWYIESGDKNISTLMGVLQLDKP